MKRVLTFIALALILLCAGCLQTPPGVLQMVASAFFIPGVGYISQPLSASNISASSTGFDTGTNVTIYCTNSTGDYVNETLTLAQSNYVYNISTVTGAQTLRFSDVLGENETHVNLTSTATNPVYAVNTSSNTTAIVNGTGTEKITVQASLYGTNGNLTYTIAGNGQDVVQISLNGVNVANNTTSGSLAVTNIVAGANNVSFSNPSTYNFTETKSNTTALTGGSGEQNITLTSNPKASTANVTIYGDVPALSGNEATTNSTAIVGGNGTHTITLAKQAIAGNLTIVTEKNESCDISVTLNTVWQGNITGVTTTATWSLGPTDTIVGVNNVTYETNCPDANVTSALINNTWEESFNVSLNGVVMGAFTTSPSTWTGKTVLNGVNVISYVSTDTTGNLTNSTIAVLYNNPANATNSTLQFTYTASTNPCANFTNVRNVTATSVSTNAPLSLSTNMWNTNTSSLLYLIGDTTVTEINTTGSTYWATLYYWNGSETLKVNSTGTYKMNGTIVSATANTTACSNSRIATPSTVSFTATNFTRSGTLRSTVSAEGSNVCSTVNRIVLSSAAHGTISVKDSTGKVISVFVPKGDYEYYQRMQTDGNTRVLPAMTLTSDAVDVTYTSSGKFYIKGTNVTGADFAMYYQVSADGSTWFNGTTLLANLTNGTSMVTMNDSANYVRIVVYNGDGVPEYPYVVLQAS